MTLLSVNLNKIAVLRNSRGGNEPDICQAAQTCIESGCGGITVHPRPDLRHVRPADVRALAAMLRGRVEYNIEGNPFAGARGEYPGLIALAREVRPTQVTLVPDGDGQITSDHGFDLRRDIERLRPLVAELLELGCRVSLFVDAGTDAFDLAVSTLRGGRNKPAWRSMPATISARRIWGRSRPPYPGWLKSRSAMR